MISLYDHRQIGLVWVHCRRSTGSGYFLKNKFEKQQQDSCVNTNGLFRSSLPGASCVYSPFSGTIGLKVRWTPVLWTLGKQLAFRVQRRQEEAAALVSQQVAALAMPAQATVCSLPPGSCRYTVSE